MGPPTIGPSVSRHEALNNFHFKFYLSFYLYCPPQVKQDVLKKYREELQRIKEDIKVRLDRGEQFHLISDEWSGIGGRKFVHVHLKSMDQKFHCLGEAIFNRFFDIPAQKLWFPLSNLVSV